MAQKLIVKLIQATGLPKFGMTGKPSKFLNNYSCLVTWWSLKIVIKRCQIVALPFPKKVSADIISFFFIFNEVIIINMESISKSSSNI